jgi:hypothetical protein
MEAYGGVEVQLHPPLISTLHEVYSRFTPEEAGRPQSRSGPFGALKNLLPLPGFEPPQIAQLVPESR